MDCCLTAGRLGGEDVKVVVRSERAKTKASPWEIDDAMAETFPSSTTTCPRNLCTRTGS